MSRWQGKIAVVTGASAGIGLAIAKIFIRRGMIVVGLARRKIKMEVNMKSIHGSGKFIPYECDVSKSENIKDVFQWIQDNVGVIQIIVNNAGIFIPGALAETTRQEWQKVFDVNVMGLLECTKHAVKMMKAADVEGHIVNINSVQGHRLRQLGNIKFNVYPASKHAVTAITETFQRELFGGKIRVTSISPGYVKTEILEALNVEIESLHVASFPALESEDVAEAVDYVIGTPQHVQITELVIKSSNEII